jgi:endonuclease/exonuclease/phosphatase family metal-dependent hydrolase
VGHHRARRRLEPRLLVLACALVVLPLVAGLLLVRGDAGPSTATKGSPVAPSVATPTTGTTDSTSERSPAAVPTRNTKSTETTEKHGTKQHRTKQPVTVIPGKVLRRKPPGPVMVGGVTGRVGTGLAVGAPSYVEAPLGQPDTGTVEAAVANLPNRTSNAGFARSMDNLTAQQPDFLMLNEVSRHSIDTIEALAPGYDAYRDPVTDPGVGGSQSLNNVVLWAAARWTLVDAGRVKLVDNDMGYDGKGDAYTWDRYATWATLQGTDGGIVSVVSAHMMTNPAYYPRQPRRSAETRIQRYSRGMDVLRATTSVLARYGPVLVGGDMNSHPGQGAWTAAAKLGSLGFGYAKDSGVMYLFYPGAEQLESSRQISVVSDHPALVATLHLD